MHAPRHVGRRDDLLLAQAHRGRQADALRVAALFAAGPEIELTDFTDNVEGLRHLGEAAAVASGATVRVPRRAMSPGATCALTCVR